MSNSVQPLFSMPDKTVKDGPIRSAVNSFIDQLASDGAMDARLAVAARMMETLATRLDNDGASHDSKSYSLEKLSNALMAWFDKFPESTGQEGELVDLQTVLAQALKGGANAVS